MLPRVLFITAHAFNRVSGGGVTFSNLFEGWPKDRLATVHCDTTPVTTDVCTRYFRLTAAELRPWGPLRYLRRQALATATAAGEGGGASPAMAGLIGRAKRLVLGDYSPETAVLTPALEAWIAEFRPQVLYTILGSNGMMALIDQVRARFDLPLVVHFMDDWPAAIYRGGLASPWQRWHMWRRLRRLVGAAKVRLGISPAMCQAFARTYGAEFQPFMNIVDLGTLDGIAANASRDPTAQRLLYAGNILPFAQLDALVDCARAVSALAAQGRPVRLDIFCPPDCVARYGDRLRVSDAITVRESMADWSSYFAGVCAADLLLLPVNFDAASVSFIRYSLPTKVPEYLASGTPVLCYGPADAAQIAYARESGWGHVVDGQGVDGLAAAIAGLLDDAAARARLGETARTVARRNHNGHDVRAAFRAALAGAACAANAAQPSLRSNAEPTR